MRVILSSGKIKCLRTLYYLPISPTDVFHIAFTCFNILCVLQHIVYGRVKDRVSVYVIISSNLILAADGPISNIAYDHCQCKKSNIKPVLVYCCI